jgi:hypothetical protein
MSMHKGMCGPNKSPGSVSDVTLADYVQRKTRKEAFNTVNHERKLTFEQWFEEYTKQHGMPPAYMVAKHAWQAAQENV